MRSYIETLRPNANGDHIGCQQDPPAGLNYDKVDEAIPDNEGTVVYVAGAVELYDLYEIPNHTEGSGIINSVTVYHNSTANGPVGNVAREKIKTHGVEYDGDIDPLLQLPVWTLFSHTWITNPFTGNPWTWDEIDNLQIGVWLDPVGAGHFPQTTQVYAEVDYKVTTRFTFIRCPKCKEFLLLERLGPVGVPRVKDSKIIKCLSCKTIFRTSGNTWKEEHGYLKV